MYLFCFLILEIFILHIESPLDRMEENVISNLYNISQFNLPIAAPPQPG